MAVVAAPAQEPDPDGRLSLSQLRDLLAKAHESYLSDLDNLEDWAAQVIQGMWESGSDGPDGKTGIPDLIRQTARDASKAADDYYATMRGLYRRAGVDMPDMPDLKPLDVDRVLWNVAHGVANTDFNGLTYTQLKQGLSRAGMTVDDLWSVAANGPHWRDGQMTMDDWQQLAGDMIRQAGRERTGQAIRTDPTHPRWARVPRGSYTCAFCLMLASRGFTYGSEEKAGGLGNVYHAHCDCQPVPSWGVDTVPGYDPDRMLEMWESARRKAGKKAGWRKALTVLRREYPDDLKDGVRTLSKPWPKDVRSITPTVWTHILVGNRGKGGHAAWAKNSGKTHFPDDWDENKIKWAVNETIVDPDEDKISSSLGTRTLKKRIESTVVEVKMVRRKNGWRTTTAFPHRDDMRGVNS